MPMAAAPIKPAPSSSGWRIERAIQSALVQPEVQTVIVVDDGSTDDTATRAKQVGSKSGRVIVECLVANRGPSAARNISLEISTAPWVAILDGDDYLHPGRIRALLSYAENWDFVADDILQIKDDEIDRNAPRAVLFGGHFEPWRLDFETFVLGDIGRRRKSRTGLGFLKPLIRRSFLDRHELRYDERLRLGEDYALYARAIAIGARFLIVPAQGYVSVIRPDSLSAYHTKKDLERFRDVDVELTAIATLTKKQLRALRRHYSSVDGRVQWLAVIEAFKARSPASFLKPFFCSPGVSLFLLKQLFGKLGRRLEKRFSLHRRPLCERRPSRHPR
jgi:succinoglycan biosynthesis protein ExoU